MLTIHKKHCECMFYQYIYQAVNYYILIAIRFPVIYCMNRNKILTVYNFHISDKDLAIEYMYPGPIYNSILLEYIRIQIYAPSITKIIIFMTIIVFELRYESYIYGIMIIISKTIFQYNNSKPIIAMHVTGIHTHLYFAAQQHFLVKNKSTELHFQHMNINISYI